MPKLQRFFHYFWPVLSGLLIAVVIAVLSPEWLNGSEPDETTEGNFNQQSGSWSGPVSYSEAARRARPSVVNIYTTKTVSRNSDNPLLNDPFFRRFFNRPLLNQTKEQRSLGSGVIISSDGYILTNAHVIEGADQILVMLYDGRQAVAEVVGEDAMTDLAVLSVEMDNLQAISIGDPNSAQVGDVALAIGNPFGFDQTVTQGIISATGRTLGGLDLVNFLQTDAAINDGNSGGALVDAYGNLLGINSRKLESTGSFGLGFAIPADIAVKVVKDIVEQGEVVRGWLGIEARQLTDDAANSLSLKRGRGMVVTGLYPGGPGHRAGFEVGDVIVKVNDRDIIDGRRVMNMIANAKPGSKLSFEILRQGQPLVINAEIDLMSTQPLL